MSLEKFISDVNGRGISRDNRFEVRGGSIPIGFETLVQTVSLPGIQFHTALYRNVGHATKYINNVMYNEMSVSFFDSGDQQVQHYYNRWIAEIYNEQGQIQYKDDYTRGRDMFIKKLDRKGKTSIEYTLNKVFPTQVSDVTLNTAGVNTASILTVTFSYDNWRVG